MSKLYTRGKGKTYWVRFTHPRTGERVQKSCQTTDKRQAEEFSARLIAAAWREGVLGEKPKRLWEEAALRWIEEKASMKRSIQDDAGKLDILNPVIGKEYLTDITNDLVRERVVRGLLAKRGVAPATVNRYVTLIKSVLNLAMKEWGWLDSAPFLSKPGQAGERQRKAWLTPEQFKRFVATLPDHSAAMARLSVATGMRFSNIAKLQWAQIDMQRRSLLIPAEVFKGKRDHYVPLNDTAASAIRSQIGNHSDRVFTYKGRPFSSVNLRHWHDRLKELGITDELREAGMLGEEEEFVFHGFRHTFATWLGRTGTPLEIVEAIGGWKAGAGEKNVRIAANYTHISDTSHLLPYARKIDSILSGDLEIAGSNLVHDTRTNLVQTL